MRYQTFDHPREQDGLGILTSHELIIASIHLQYLRSIAVEELRFSCDQNQLSFSLIGPYQQKFEFKSNSLEELSGLLRPMQKVIRIGTDSPQSSPRNRMKCPQSEKQIGASISASRFKYGPFPDYFCIGAALVSSLESFKSKWVPKKTKKHENLFFSGSEIIRWLMEHLGVDTEQANLIAAQLLALGFFYSSNHTEESYFETSTTPRYVVSVPKVANARIPWDRPCFSPLEVIESALRILIDLYQYYKPLFRRAELSVLEVSKL